MKKRRRPRTLRGRPRRNQQTSKTSKTSKPQLNHYHESTTELLEKAITDKILRVFYRVYDYLGFGFLEAVYCNALAIEFAAEGIEFIREPRIDVYYKGNQTIGQYKSDFLVEGRVVVEVKASEILSYAHKRQLLNCLSASDPEVGLLLHFGPKIHFERFVHTNKRRA